MSDETVEVSISKLLGTVKESLAQQLVLYIPDKDRDGKIIKNLDKWIKEARRILTIFGRGSTAMPPADGTWLDPNKEIEDISELEDKDIIWEKTRLLYAYIDPNEFLENAKILREFLHRLGRETNQGEVVFEFHGKLYRIQHFDQK